VNSSLAFQIALFAIGCARFGNSAPGFAGYAISRSKNTDTDAIPLTATRGRALSNAIAVGPAQDRERQGLPLQARPCSPSAQCGNTSLSASLRFVRLGGSVELRWSLSYRQLLLQCVGGAIMWISESGLAAN
jgi:hypothetical protein